MHAHGTIRSYDLPNSVRLDNIAIECVRAATAVPAVKLSRDNEYEQVHSRNSPFMVEPRSFEPTDYPSGIGTLLERENKEEIVLRQADFIHGTYRITEPGFYVLGEDIEFSPNPGEDGQPTLEQTTHGPYSSRAYHLGFFAAITVECDDVTVDLRGHTLEQSVLHQRQQRFLALIELGSSPFPSGAGPANFGTPSERCKNVIVRNGKLGRSSHHGIHGNDPDTVLIENLEITGTEIAGISINGATNLVIRHVDCKDIGQAEMNAKLSQSIFLLPFLKRIVEHQPNGTIKLSGTTRSVRDIYSRLALAVRSATDTAPTTPRWLQTENGLSDGHVYGIILAGKGVHVGEVKADIEDGANSNIVVHDCTITIGSEPREIVAYRYADAASDDTPGDAPYGAKRAIGPVGDVFDLISVMDDDGHYKGDPLSDAQITVAHLGEPKHKGRTNIGGALITWAEGGTLLDSNLVYGGDSMGHVMKGSVGLFLPQVHNAQVGNCRIIDVANHSTNTGAAGAAYGLAISRSLE